NEHTPAEMPDRGHKDRPPRKPRKTLDLRHVLVLETERVKLEGGAAVAIMRLDHRSAAAGIAADRAYRDRVVRRDEPRLDERAQQADSAGRVTAGIGDFARRRDLSGLIGRHFRKAVGPFGIDPVRGAGVEQFRRAGAQRPGEGGWLSRTHHVLPSGRILTLRLRQAAQRYPGHQFEPLPDAESGRTSLAVDEDARVIARHRSAALLTGGRLLA